MPITLSTTDLSALSRAARVLASPLEHGGVNRWRAAVNRELRQLLAADSVGFLLPVDDGPLFYSEEHDAATIAKYAEITPPPLADGTSIFERGVALGVSTLALAYGADYPRYLESEYYNEYAAPNRACDTLAAMLPVRGPGAVPIAAVQCWHDRPTGRQFGDRELALLGLLLPALHSGVEMVMQWRRYRAAMLSTIDAIGQAALVCDRTGRALHQTPALTDMLAADPEAATLRTALHRAAAAAGAALGRGGYGPASGSPAAQLRTAHARYRVRSTVYGAPEERDPLVLACVERVSPMPPTADALRAAFALTPAEARVALMLARGKSNADIADALATRPSTARRHTERVLQKLGVTSRAAVGPRIAERA